MIRTCSDRWNAKCQVPTRIAFVADLKTEKYTVQTQFIASPNAAARLHQIHISNIGI